MKPVTIISFIILFLILTVLTQVGGIILLLCLPFFLFIKRKIKNTYKSVFIQIFTFISIYGMLSVTLIPFLARKSGRVALPMGITQNSTLIPLNVVTCIFNRHYVKPKLYQALMNVSNMVNRKHKENIVCYLDANFPFLDGFPLFPHLSHNDGKKADLAFLYKNNITGKEVHGKAPSFIGYGICEKPQPNEVNMPLMCENKGYWQYNLLEKIVPELGTQTFSMDNKRTKELIILLAAQPSLEKIFIEPHLKQRLNLQQYSNIRFHGCQAVRHDDHIHIQLK